MSRIISLTAENIKRVQAVEIRPSKSMTIIGGRNFQGKSSVIDSIQIALNGAKGFQVPVRIGADHGEVVVETEDLIVKRTLMADGSSTLVVTDKAGAKISSPQKILDKLASKLTYDPLAFSRMEDDKQLETLRQLVGIDFTALNAERKEAYDAREQLGRDGKALKGRVDAMPDHTNVPDQEVSVSDLAAKLQEALTLNAANDAVRTKLKNAEQQAALARRDVEAAEAALRKAQASLATAEAAVQSATAESGGRPVNIDTAPIQQQLSEADAINRKVRENSAKRDLMGQLVKAQVDYKALTTRIVAIDAKKTEIVAKAKFPVPELSLDETGVFYKGAPFSQASAAEKIVVSVAIGLALNPELKVMLIRDASLLDDDMLQVIADMAEQANAQVWVERVGEHDQTAVIIEDGLVKSQPQVEPANALPMDRF
jgi:hypothetical protein